MHFTSRKARSFQLSTTLASAYPSKRSYFKAVRAAKAAHWRSLLATGTPCFIGTVMKLSLGTSSPRSFSLRNAMTTTQIDDSLLHHFFPSQPNCALPSILCPDADCALLSPNEMSCALAKGSPSSRARPRQHLVLHLEDSLPHSPRYPDLFSRPSLPFWPSSLFKEAGKQCCSQQYP